MNSPEAFAKTPLALAVCAALFGAVAQPASAGITGLDETESNDVFGDRNEFAVGPGEHLVNGNIFEGDVDFLSFTGLTPGHFWRAATRDDGGDRFDSVLGVFDADGGLLALNDDAPGMGNDGEFGDGGEGYSLLGGIVGASGVVNLGLTGFDDFDFDGVSDSDPYGGAHPQFSNYELQFDSFNINNAGLRLGGVVTLPDEAPFLCGGVVEGFCFGGLDIADGKVVTLDPPMTEGWDFTTDAGTFATAQFPLVGADSEFTIIVGGMEYAVSAGDIFDFSAETGSTPMSFMLRGIDPAENLDSDDPTAFPVTFTFAGASTANVQWTPFFSARVPEPGTLALAFSAAGLGWFARRRASHSTNRR